MTTSMIRAVTTAPAVSLSALAPVATAASTRALVLTSRLSARPTLAARIHFAAPRSFVTATSSKPLTPPQTSLMQHIIPQAARPSRSPDQRSSLLRQQFRAAHFRSRARQAQRNSAPSQKPTEEGKHIASASKPATEEHFSSGGLPRTPVGTIWWILSIIVWYWLVIRCVDWFVAYERRRAEQLRYERSQRMIVANLADQLWSLRVCVNTENLSKMERTELEQLCEALGIPSSLRQPDDMTKYVDKAVRDFSRTADEPVLSVTDKILDFLGPTGDNLRTRSKQQSLV